MAFEFKLEDPGEGIHEAEILEILVSVRDPVEEGDNVLVAETDKAAVDIPSPVTGTVAEIKVDEGDIVEVGDVLIVFDEAGATESAEGGAEEEDAERAGPDSKEPEPQRSDGEDEDGEDAEDAATATSPEGEPTAADDERTAKPKPARDRGPKDETANEAGEEADGETSQGGRGERRPVPATPAARRLARELGVDLETVDGSGADGRVREADLRAAAGGQKQGADAAKDGDLPDFSRWGRTERVALRSIRRAVARRMAESWRAIPHVTHQDQIDVTELETFRQAHADDIAARGGHLTLTPFFVKALVAALKEHPRFNVSFDAAREEIVMKDYYNIGVALDTDRGLLVPVIHGADAKSIADIAVELAELAATIRSGRATRDQLRGGTFSLTNVGSLGGTQFSPIINHPEAAIFGTARAQLRPVVTGDIEDYRVEARLMLPVCLAFDHRINDGADAARFVDTVKSVLSDPEALMLVS